MLAYEHNISIRKRQEQIDLFRSCGAIDPEREIDIGISELSDALCMAPMSRQEVMEIWSDSDQWVKNYIFMQVAVDRYNIFIIDHGGLDSEIMLSHELGHVLEGHLCKDLSDFLAENLLLYELEADRHAAYTWGVDNTVEAIYNCVCASVSALIKLQMVEEAEDLIKNHWPRFEHLGQTMDQYRERLKEKLSSTKRNEDDSYLP